MLSKVNAGVLLGLLCAIAPRTSTAQSCEEQSPAFPIPEYREGVRLWPDRFRPADPPGVAIPLDRDSTDYISTTIPCAQTGHEEFLSLDIAADTLFVAYNVGLSAWRIDGTFATRPQRMDFRDGLMDGHFLFHPPYGEADGYVRDIAVAALSTDPNTVVILLSGYNPVGNTLWAYDVAGRRLRPLYQDTEPMGEASAIAEYNGRIYGFVPCVTGVWVYDITAALALPEPCLDEPPGSCPGIRLGSLSGLEERGRYVDVLAANDGLLVAASVGGLSANSPLPVLHWVTNPAVPSSATVLTHWGVRNTHSPVFIPGSTLRMASVEQNQLVFRDVTACLSGSCSVTDPPVRQVPLSEAPGNYHFLTLSTSHDRRILYHGLETYNSSGSSFEVLLDVTDVATSPPIDLLAGGGSYVDPCNGKPGVGYFADSYHRNAYGYRGVNPRKGHFEKNVFYRASFSLVDVHTWDGPEVPDAGSPDGNVGDSGRSDGDIADGERSDGDLADGERSDGDLADSERSDGDLGDSERSDGDLADSGQSDGYVADSGQSDASSHEADGSHEPEAPNSFGDSGSVTDGGVGGMIEDAPTDVLTDSSMGKAGRGTPVSETEDDSSCACSSPGRGRESYAGWTLLAALAVGLTRKAWSRPLRLCGPFGHEQGGHQ